MMTNKQIEEYFDDFKLMNEEVIIDTPDLFEERLEKMLGCYQGSWFEQMELSFTD